MISVQSVWLVITNIVYIDGYNINWGVSPVHYELIDSCKYFQTNLTSAFYAAYVDDHMSQSQQPACTCSL